MKNATSITVGGAAALFTIILVWALNKYAHAEVPDEVGQAFTGLLTFLAGWFRTTPPPVDYEGEEE